MSTAADWWAHLDSCEQCQHSHNTTHRGADLCTAGRRLLARVGLADPPWMEAERREVRRMADSRLAGYKRRTAKG